ncbi:hypothetical protein [Couchioplanes caeruleus]|uniref:Uncharacterized protein n=2 Tax=Couchioplanes caeruleus TaxID=56438 RepID=A0A1K0FMY2_9ACTN|nr:hypothetical protein [Couchioplanes caeruleus]OJF14191.1 hypothetical protein BG844_11070 [Couchioplanes caeruleus subsp. caeruleus]ROP28316.1 hypothetical protein EDD30_1063 [Couchioplanes caeruleus]
MKTSQRPTLPRKTKPTSTASVTFRDGMIVTAEDLAASQQYSVSLLQTVLRAYFGRGVVCGLSLAVKTPPEKQPAWVVRVDPGMAIDCEGRPIELCGPVELDLSPEACSCQTPPDEVYLLARRVTTDEAPKDPCSCSCASDLDAAQFDCRRTREQVLIQAFSREDLEALRAKVCRRPEEEGDAHSLCAGWTRCPGCGCGECWILLGSVKLDKDNGIDGLPDMTERAWVNPIEVLCTKVEDRLAALEKNLADLKPPPASAAPAVPGSTL